MDWKQLLARLQLDYETPSDKEIEPCFSNRDVLVCNCHGHLPREANALEAKLHAQCLLVNAFQQAGAQDTVDLGSGGYHDTCDLVEREIRFREFGVLVA